MLAIQDPATEVGTAIADVADHIAWREETVTEVMEVNWVAEAILRTVIAHTTHKDYTAETSAEALHPVTIPATAKTA